MSDKTCVTCKHMALFSDVDPCKTCLKIAKDGGEVSTKWEQKEVK